MITSPQAKTAAWFVGLVLLLGPLLVALSLRSSVGTNQAALIWLVTFVVALPSALLILFDIDCTVNGQCNIWGWIKTLILIACNIFIIVLVIVAMVRANKNDEETSP